MYDLAVVRTETLSLLDCLEISMIFFT